MGKVGGDGDLCRAPYEDERHPATRVVRHELDRRVQRHEHAAGGHDSRLAGNLAKSNGSRATGHRSDGLPALTVAVQ